MLPRGQPVQLYHQGEPRELMLMSYEISGEPETGKMPRQAENLLLQFHTILNSGNMEKAEALIHKANAIAPNVPTLQYNLSAVLMMQNKHKEGETLLRQIAEKHPDYLFARTGMARLEIKAGNLEEARNWLTPLLEQPRFHISEFASLAMAQAELAVAEKQPESARSWMQMWEEADPDNPNIAAFKRELRLKGLRI